MAFFPGAVGVIYRQFSLTMVVSILFSALLALSLTPALCASFLKQVRRVTITQRTGFFGWFNRRFDRTAIATAVRVVADPPCGRFMIIYLAVLAGLGYLFIKLPSSFLPDEDQGYVIV